MLNTQHFEKYFKQKLNVKMKLFYLFIYFATTRLV